MSLVRPRKPSGISGRASTAAPIMLQLIEKAFADKVATPEWQARLKRIIPSYGQKLNDDLALTNRVRQADHELGAADAARERHHLRRGAHRNRSCSGGRIRSAALPPAVRRAKV